MNPNNDPNRGKQINRVATPIKLDASGQRIESDDNPVILTSEEKKEIIENKRIEAINKKIEEHDPTTAIFVVVLLIIAAILAAFIFLYVMPRVVESKNHNYQYNDKKSTTTINKEIYKIKEYTLLDTPYVTDIGTYNVNNFNIKLEYNGDDYNISVNDTMVTRADYLISKVATIDDLIMFTTQNKESRTTKLYAVDTAGVVVKEFYNLGDDGMVLLPDSSSVIYNSVNIVVLGSRVLDKQLILDNGFGKVTGIDICNNNLLSEYKVDDNFSVLGTYSIEYLGNHEFSEPRLINSTSLCDYKTTNNYCI